MGIQGNFINLIKNYKKSTANLIINGENKSNAFLLVLRIRQVCVLSLLPLNLVLEVLPSAVKQENEIKDINWKGRSQTSPIAGDVIVGVEHFKELGKKNSCGY